MHSRSKYMDGKTLVQALHCQVSFLKALPGKETVLGQQSMRQSLSRGCLWKERTVEILHCQKPMLRVSGKKRVAKVMEVKNFMIKSTECDSSVESLF